MKHRRKRVSRSTIRKYSAELEQRLREQSQQERREKLSQFRDWLRFEFPFRLIIFFSVFLLFFAGIVFLAIKIWSIVLPILVARLGIPTPVGIALLIATGACIKIHTPDFSTDFLAWINIPLYMVAAQDGQVRYELFPIWLLRRNQPTYKSDFKPHTFVGINVVGGLLPLSLALYQFSRTPPSSILIVTAIVAVVCYFSVRVVPGIGIYLKPGFLWLVSIATALSAMWVVVGGIDRTDVSVAFAGGVLGSLIGADLLHLKDLQLEKGVTPLSIGGAGLNIGGAGLNDGIVLCGFYSLLLAEWMPNLVTFLKL